MQVRALTAAQLLEVWERGLDRSPAEQALITLMAASDAPRAQLEALSLARRDALLLEARALTFGDALNAYVRCPHCGESLEFTLTASALAAPTANAESFDAQVDDVRVQLRLPNTSDLLAVRACGDVPSARRALLTRCVQSATRAMQPIAVSELDDDWHAQLAAQWDTHDTHGDTQLALACAACGARWSALFEIGTFFFQEIAAQAQRLLREVDQLARAYGWREADILALSAPRRARYLTMCESR